MVSFSDDVIEGMGYSKAPKNMTLSAKFHRLHVFTIQGIRLDEGTLIAQTVTRGANEIQIGIGNSVNAISNNILSDSFTDDEINWQTDRDYLPPYVVVHFGPTQTHTENLRYLRRDGNTVRTYDTFRAAKLEIEQVADEHLPSIVTGLSCALFKNGSPLTRLIHIDKIAFGITDAGQFVDDLRLEVSASAYTASDWDALSIREALEKVPDFVTKIDDKSASFFHLALSEKDDLKRFLYFFLAIEIATNLLFKALIQEQRANKLFGERAKSWVKNLQVRYLSDRFLLCSLFVWKHLSDADIETFKKIKNTRNDIAHGNCQRPGAGDVQAAELLATKIHSFQ
jgi:hypothetical protein